MIKIKWLIGLVVISWGLNAQTNRKIDSLKNLISLAKEDTNKVNFIDQLSGEYTFRIYYDSALKYWLMGFPLAR